MTISPQAQAIRMQLASVDRRSSGRPYPEHLRQAVRDYITQVRSQGGSIERTARELGVSESAVRRWIQRPLAEPTMSAALRRVQVVAHDSLSAAPDCQSCVVVWSSSGLRIEGLTLSALAELLRAVG